MSLLALRSADIVNPFQPPIDSTLPSQTPTTSFPESQSSSTGFTSTVTTSSTSTFFVITTYTPEPLSGVVPPSSKSHRQVIIISSVSSSCVLIIACTICYLLKWKRKRRRSSMGASSAARSLGAVEALVEPFLSPRTTSMGRQTADPPLRDQPWRPTSIRALGKLARFGKTSASQPVPSASLSTVYTLSTTENLEQQIRSLHNMMQQVSATVARMETGNTRSMNAHGDTPSDSEDPPPDYADSRSGR